MTKRATLLMLLLCGILSHKVCAQMIIGGSTLYGNEWIDYNQSYFEIKVSTDGIYQISQSELSASGVFSQASIPTGANFQLFHRGEEIPIYVTTSGAFSTNDYIEFYGRKNDGWLDKFLYVEEDMHPNPEYSMFSDESTYFLTWNTATNNERYTDYAFSLPSAITKEDYCWRTEKEIYSNKYNRGKTFSGSTSSATAADGISSRYYTAEGYGSNLASNHNVLIATPFFYSSGGDATISAYLNTQSGNHQISFDLDVTNYTSPSFSDWEVKNEIFTSPASTISSSTAIDIQNATPFRLNSVSIEYARTFNFDNSSHFEFALNSSIGDQYVEITNFNSGASDPILYDLTNNRRVIAVNDAGTVKAVLPPSATKRNCVLVSTVDFYTTTSMEENDFYPFDFDSGKYNYLILSNNSLFDDGNGMNYIQEYANYRDNLSGFDYRPLVVDVEQLYDQFGYGTKRHEQSIKNFLKKASLSNSWSPKHLFIIGKGWDKRKLRNTSTPNEFDVVPTFGFPHSDYAFVMDHTSIIPWMSVGRLAAYTSDQVRIYLEKMQAYETALNATPQTIADKAWMKDILHFGGGDATIQSTIQSTLVDLTNIIEPSTFGGNVTNFFSRDNEDSADPSLAIDYINKGASLLTFFGHSAPNTIDFDIGAPEDYDSDVTGSFPLIYAIGCNTNRVFDYNTTLSEDYVLIEDKGAIGWYGNTWITFLSSLIPLAENFYENLGTDNYGETFGEIFKQSLTEFDSQVSPNSANELVALSSMLHGDPAIQLRPHTKSDFIVDELITSTSPKLIGLQDDSITLNLEIANIGINNNGMLTINLEHFDPNNNSIYSNQISVSAPTNSSNYIIKIPFDSENSLLGTNQVVITLDPNNDIEEVSNGGESNNQATISFVIVESDVKPSFPTNFSIFTGGTLKVKASTFDSPGGAANYYIQIDTTENFDSPLLKTTVVNSVGGVIEWEPNITLINNTAYYWRISAGDISAEISTDWKNSSFTYILGIGEGWNQQHQYQYEKNKYTDIELAQNSTNISFEESILSVRVLDGSFPNLNWEEVAIFLDGFRELAYYPCDNSNPKNTIQIVEFDQYSLEVIKHFDPCKNISRKRQEFQTQIQSERERMMDYLQNTIQSGNYVALFTTLVSGQDYGADQWEADAMTYGTNIFNLLEAQGAQYIRDLENSQTPYILMFKKDDPSFTVSENHAAFTDEIIESRSNFVGLFDKGSITSTTIGPAASWDNLVWQASDVEVDDSTYVKVYGISSDQQSKTLLNTAYDGTNFSLTAIDAAQYPYLELEYVAIDFTERTPAQLDYWRVIYTPSPDIAVAPNVSYSFNSPTLSLGDNLELDFTVSNLSSTAISSPVNVLVTILDSTGSIVSIQNETLASLGANASMVYSLSYDTDGDLGLSNDNGYELVVSINDNRLLIEECYENNDLSRIKFFIENCPVNRVVETTFSGITTVKVSNIITADNVIEAGANVIYSGGTLIHLLPGFHAEYNSDFHAFLGGCSLTPPAMINSSSEDEYEEDIVESRFEEVKEVSDDWKNVEIKIIPNPVNNQAQIKFFMPETTTATIYISDLNGRIVTQLNDIQIQKGWNSSQFYAGDLPSGIYTVIVRSKLEIAVERFSVQR